MAIQFKMAEVHLIETLRKTGTIRREIAWMLGLHRNCEVGLNAGRHGRHRAFFSGEFFGHRVVENLLIEALQAEIKQLKSRPFGRKSEKSSQEVFSEGR